MGRENYVLPAPDTVSMPGEAARKLIGCGSGDAALCYLYILSSGGRFDREDAALRTGRTTAQIDAAMDVLRRLGLVLGSEEPAPAKLQRAEELPQYTTDDVRRELERGSGFRTLSNEVQTALGRQLSGQELITLFGIYDYLALPPEVILMLVTHCREEVSRKSGPGARLTLRYIEKAAFTWEREGIFSVEAADAYLRMLSARRDSYAGFAAALGIKDRLLSESERRYVDSWMAMGFGPESAGCAYDRTVLQTGKLSWNYMDKILKRWHAAGLHSPEDIEKHDTFSRKAQTPVRGQTSGASEDDITRMRELREKMKRGSN